MLFNRLCKAQENLSKLDTDSIFQDNRKPKSFYTPLKRTREHLQTQIACQLVFSLDQHKLNQTQIYSICILFYPGTRYIKIYHRTSVLCKQRFKNQNWSFRKPVLQGASSFSHSHLKMFSCPFKSLFPARWSPTEKNQPQKC